MNISFLALQTASRAFATDSIPDEWNELNPEEQADWLSENRWQPFENENNDSFYALIDDHADTVKDAICQVLNVLKERLCEASIDGTLPLD